MESWITLPLETQVSLAAGYAGYLLAYGGLRRSHQAQDAVFLTFAFGAVALVALRVLANAAPVWIAAPGAALAALLAAALWRRWLRIPVLRATGLLGIHRDDGMTDSWEAFVDRVPHESASQVSVHTSDGRVLYCSNLDRYVDLPMRGFYLGSDGGIAMVVEEEELPGGTTETREAVTDPHYGARMTYIPAAAVVRVNLRYRG